MSTPHRHVVTVAASRAALTPEFFAAQRVAVARVESALGALGHALAHHPSCGWHLEPAISDEELEAARAELRAAEEAQRRADGLPGFTRRGGWARAS